MRWRAAAAVAGIVAFAVGSASESATGRSAEDAVAIAAAIRAQVDARYARFRVSEASTTAVIDSLTLFARAGREREVPAQNGIYFAICPNKATCPNPNRGARPAGMFEPRRIGLELAARTFAATSADLVVVSLPTASFVLLVLERSDVDPHVLATIARPNPARQASPELRAAVDAHTLGRLYAPFWLGPVGDGRTTLAAAAVTP